LLLFVSKANVASVCASIGAVQTKAGLKEALDRLWSQLPESGQCGSKAEWEGKAKEDLARYEREKEEFERASASSKRALVASGPHWLAASESSKKMKVEH
jgi:hypothetical protein